MLRTLQFKNKNLNFKKKFCEKYQRRKLTLLFELQFTANEMYIYQTISLMILNVKKKIYIIRMCLSGL